MSRRTAVLTRVRRVLLVAGVALAALPAAPALAVTIGQTGGDTDCGAGSPNMLGDTNYAVPAGGGIITSFSFASVGGNVGHQVDFLVLRPTSTPGSYTVVGKTGLVTLAGTGVETFAATIPVQGGDILGLWEPGGLLACARAVASGGGFIGNGAGPDDPSVDALVSFPESSTMHDLNLSANLVVGPTSKDQCKDGGWRDFGTMFKNQGECVTLFDTDT